MEKSIEWNSFKTDYKKRFLKNFINNIIKKEKQQDR
jgi:hypothetical protein